MEQEVPKLGSCLFVPSVQELAKKPLTTIPDRYVRQDLEPSVASDDYLPQVPVIDLSKLLSEDLTSSELELEKLDYACKDWGFFQLVNHGVSPALVENVKKGVEDFFNLPTEEKKALQQKPGALEGFGQMFVQTDEQKLEWADLFNIVTLPSHSRNNHLFSSIPLPFRENLEAYFLELRKLATKMMQLMAKALKMEANEISDLLEEGRQSMRMNYYPPCPQPQRVIGLNPHSDVGALTILIQANEIEGLQIRKDGKWVPIKPLPNAFVINIGDVLEILTNGIYRSIEHRVTVNSENERISIATFHGPKLKGCIGPSPSLVSPERPALFKTVNVVDYYKAFFSSELKGKSQIDLMRLQNGNDKRT